MSQSATLVLCFVTNGCPKLKVAILLLAEGDVSTLFPPPNEVVVLLPQLLVKELLLLLNEKGLDCFVVAEVEAGLPPNVVGGREADFIGGTPKADDWLLLKEAKPTGVAGLA